jgi:hypothetical protein
MLEAPAAASRCCWLIRIINEWCCEMLARVVLFSRARKLGTRDSMRVSSVFMT